MDNRICAPVNTPTHAARGQELQQRTSERQRTVRRGRAMEADASFQRSAGGITGMGACAVTIPLFAMFPPAGVLAIYAMAGAETNKLFAQALMASSAYRFNRRDFDALFETTPEHAFRALQALEDAQVVRRLELRGSGSQVRETVLTVNPKARIADVMDDDRFDFLDDDTFFVLKHFLQRVVEMAPVVEACDDVERQLQAAIQKRDNEKTKMLSEQLLTLQACWASDGKTPIVHDTAFDTKAEHRMLADLRKKLGEEISRGAERDRFKIRRLQADIKQFEMLVINEAALAEDLIDLSDAPRNSTADNLIDL